MPTPVLMVAPMPLPASRYQVPEAALASTPASFQSRSSALCVPLSSPRETNGALASAIFLKAATTSLEPAIAGRVLGRADDDEVVVHDVEALHAASPRRRTSPPRACRARTARRRRRSARS